VVQRLVVAIALVASTIAGALAAPAGAVVNSTVGAGYVQTPDVGVSVAETEFRVPTITCANNNDIEQLRLGAVGFTGAAATGTDDLYAEVVALCFAGSITYTATAVLPGASPQSATVSPGWVIDVYFRESVSISVATVDRIKPTMTRLVDMTGNGASDQSVLIGHQNVSTNPVIPTFTDTKTGKENVYFLSSYVNGYEMKYDTYPTEQVRLVNNFIVDVTASALNTSNKFHLVFKHN
jgi:hypothetical protein